MHRESATGDAVELNVVHGSHYQVSSLASFPVGKIWGPWLWYLVSPYCFKLRLDADIMCFDRTMARKRMPQIAPSRSLKAGCTAGSTTQSTNLAAPFRESSCCPTGVLRRVLLSFSATTTPTSQRWTKERTIITTNTQTPSASSKLMIFDPVTTDSTPGPTAAH